MPADTNPAGDIFGGWLLSQMDIAGGIVAKQRSKGTSMKIAMQAWVIRGTYADERIKVTEGVFTYVAVDENRRPRPVPKA
jgi:acyl-CoA thioesterase YciA